MAVRLRLTRMGRKKKPFYRVVAVDGRKKRDGEYIENLGYYNPLSDPIDVKLNEERIFYWLGVGAQPSETVRSLLRHEGIMFKWDLIKKGFDEERIQEELKKLEVIQLERKRKSEQVQEKGAEEEAAVKEETAPKEEAQPESAPSETAPAEEAAPAEAEAKEEVSAEPAPEEKAEETASDVQEESDTKEA
ncbi:MAG: 30S ribosomal protein S16 [Calditrichaeota bacterium]|nr:30S ribosomal protein S16 [Calditrichota bacterium]